MHDKINLLGFLINFFTIYNVVAPCVTVSRRASNNVSMSVLKLGMSVLN